MKKTKLSNGKTVYANNQAEAKSLSESISGYFSHGIEVMTGDIVFDVGSHIGMFPYGYTGIYHKIFRCIALSLFLKISKL